MRHGGCIKGSPLTLKTVYPFLRQKYHCLHTKRLSIWVQQTNSQITNKGTDITDVKHKSQDLCFNKFNIGNKAKFSTSSNPLSFPVPTYSTPKK